MEQVLPTTMSGKEYYERYKDTHCHINSKKYFPNLAAINVFLESLKKTNKNPLDDAYKRGFRNLLKSRPTSKDPVEWNAWKNKILERLTMMSNIPADLCELPVRIEKVVEPKKTTRCAINQPLPFEQESPPLLHTSDKLVSNDASDTDILPLGFSREVYIWKDMFTPITESLDEDVSDLLERITSDKEITPYLVECTNAKTYSTKKSIKDETVYTYFLSGGAAYRGLAHYLQHQLPTLPMLEDIAPKSHDYDINIYSTDIKSLPISHIFSIMIDFCEGLFKTYRSVFNKVHKQTIDGVPHTVQFIKPSPVMERKGSFDYDYEYVQDRFLVTSVLFYKSASEPPTSLAFQISMCLQITTPSETYCSSDHILDLLFTKEEKEPLTEQLDIQSNSWYPLIDIKSVLSHIANKQRIACLRGSQAEAIQRFQIKNIVYQLPNISVLCLISVNALVNRGVLEDIRFYKARQDYARMVAVLRMLQTLPTEMILSREDISYLYTLLKSITVHPKWNSMSEDEKHAMIQQYKDTPAEDLKTVHTAKFYDRSAKKYKIIPTWSYYKGPYEEFRTHPKAEDPLLWELGQVKFDRRRHIIDTKTKEELAKTRRKSCDGTAPVTRRTVKKRSTAHKTRKHRSL